MSPLPVGVGDGAVLRRAVRALVAVGFEELHLNRIAIRSGVDSHRSRAIPERLGSTFEGVERGGGRGTAGYDDLNVPSLLRDG